MLSTGMMFREKPSYIIQGFRPPADKGQVAGYGFSVGLTKEFADKAASIEMSEDQYNRIHSVGNALITREFGYTIFPPYEFVEVDGKRTFLVQHCRVPGSACDLGCAPSNFKSLQDGDLLEYYPHNVDHMFEAYTLLSLWLKWWDIANAFTSDL